MSGDLVLVGAPVDGDGGVPRAGAAYLFRITTGELVRAFRKPAAAEGDFFGGAVAMVAGNVVVGAPLDDTVAVDAGALYLFDRPTGAPLLTLVDPAATWTVDPGALASRSRNTPYAGMTLPVRVVATFLHGEPTVLDGKAVR